MSDTLLTRLAHSHIITPFGALVAADLNSSLAKFRNGGVYTVTIRLSAQDATPLIERIDARMDSIFSVTNNLRMPCPYEPEDHGTYLFHFCKAARTTNRAGVATKHAPKMWDAKGNAWPKFHRLELGESVRVSSGFAHDYKGDGGVSLELLSVQTAAISALPAPRQRKRIAATQAPDTPTWQQRRAK